MELQPGKEVDKTKSTTKTEQSFYIDKEIPHVFSALKLPKMLSKQHSYYRSHFRDKEPGPQGL